MASEVIQEFPISPLRYSLYIIGSFTSPPWVTRVPMTLETDCRRAFFHASLGLSDSDLFKFLLEDHSSGRLHYFCSQNYPQAPDRSGNLNNTLNTPQQEEESKEYSVFDLGADIPEIEPRSFYVPSILSGAS